MSKEYFLRMIYFVVTVSALVIMTLEAIKTLFVLLAR